MPAYTRTPEVLPVHELDAIRDALLSSPLVGRSTLGGSFRQSRGFAVTFTKPGAAEVAQRFPMLEAFLALALNPSPDLAPLREKLAWNRLFASRARQPDANAFYVNLLVIGSGGGVGRHIDATLREPGGEETALPKRVSVLYLEVPEGCRGGELCLYDGPRPVARITPKRGTLVHFRGDLLHEVTPLECADSEARRISLVCEQYALAPASLERLAPVRVQSKAGFDAYVAHFRELAR